jgi:hypothetical protein
MKLGDRTTYRETQAHTVLACRKKGFERLIRVDAPPTRPRVPDAKDDTFAVAFQLDADPPIGGAGAFHRLAGVSDQIDDELAKKDGIATHPDRLLWLIEFYLNASSPV